MVDKTATMWFENMVDGKKTSKWLLESRNLVLYSSVLYMIIVYICRSYMRNLRAVDLRRTLLFWNAGVTVFSVVGSLRMITAVYHIVQTTGATGSLCRDLHTVAPQSAIFWIWLFVVSKVFQLTDGLFSALRKKEYASFYCYYRMGMLLIASYTYGLHPSEIIWYATADYVINIAVYGSYTLKLLGLHIPRSIPTSVITMQIFRTILDLTITIRAIDSQLSGSTCAMSVGCAFFNIAFIFSFIFIFCGYLYDVCIVANQKDRKTSVAIFLNLRDKFILFLKTFNTLYQGEEDDELKDM